MCLYGHHYQLYEHGGLLLADLCEVSQGPHQNVESRKFVILNRGIYGLLQQIRSTDVVDNTRKNKQSERNMRTTPKRKDSGRPSRRVSRWLYRYDERPRNTPAPARKIGRNSKSQARSRQADRRSDRRGGSESVCGEIVRICATLP